jgi:phage tail sheath gpL-like
MTVPVAADPTSSTPGFWLTIDLLRSETSPGIAGLTGLLLSPRQTGEGDITDDTEIREVYSKEDVKTAAGRCLGYYAIQAILANDPKAKLELICPAESGGSAASNTLTFAGAPTSDMTFEVDISGHPILLSWKVGEALTDARDNAFPKINQYVDKIFCVAAAGTGGVVDLDANSKGPAGNDITLRVKVISGAGGTLTAGSANFTGGATEPDFTTALETAEVKEYDFILPCISNAEAQSASTSNQSRVEDHMDGLKTGRNAKLQQAHIGSSGTFALAKVGAIGRNSEIMSHLCFENAEDLPCEIAGADMGDRMARRRKEKNANRCLTKLKWLRGAADKVANDPTTAESDDALDNGVSAGGYTANGEVLLLRSVTCHSQDDDGNPDKRIFDTNEVDAIYELGKDLRTYLPQQFLSSGSQVKITKDIPANEEADTPEGVVEERDVKAAVTKRIRDYFVPKGVIDGVEFEKAVENGAFIVKVNDGDEKQVDIFIPAEPYKILAKMGVYLAKTG